MVGKAGAGVASAGAPGMAAGGCGGGVTGLAGAEVGVVKLSILGITPVVCSIVKPLAAAAARGIPWLPMPEAE